MFGQAISLNYEGEDTFKTIPGGVLSLILLLAMGAYTILKGSYMFDRREWKLTQQTVILNDQDMEEPIALKDYKNVSMYLEFSSKK